MAYLSSEALPMFVIYERPTDYPEHFVLRRTVILHGQAIPDAEPMAVTKDLESCRAALPSGLYNIGRYAEDEPQILEVWV